MTAELIPRTRKRKRQPTADRMREQLTLAADEIIRLRADNERLRRPWWRRMRGITQTNHLKGTT